MITFDYLMLNAIVKEEKDYICGARINKIQQPTRRELIFSLRNHGQTRQFYININPKFYHVCFMSEENLKKRIIEIPQKPPMFCMLLRKYLNNAKISKVHQPYNERILELYFESYNELNDKISLCLAVELMGKYSNIILYNTDTDIILGCAHNVGAEKSSVREVYGKIPYIYPPKNEQNNLINFRYAFLKSFKKDIFPKNFNSIVDNYYASMIEKHKFKTLKRTYLSEIQNRLNKVSKSLNKTEQSVLKNTDFDKFRLYGDLIMANLYNFKDYSEEIEVFDYENNTTVSIKLDKTKTLKENANIFYKKYNKSKVSNEKLTGLIEEQKIHKQYLENLLYSVEIAVNITELKDIEEEIIPQNKKDKPKPQMPLLIEKDNQTRIYIGKNNKQNDYIISKLADDDDLWFHTKDCPGSHVLLKTQQVTDELILECAKFAKKYSSASESSKVGVIYTKRKYLRKPPKANLGYVTYKNEKEIIIE